MCSPTDYEFEEEPRTFQNKVFYKMEKVDVIQLYDVAKSSLMPQNKEFCEEKYQLLDMFVFACPLPENGHIFSVLNFYDEFIKVSVSDKQNNQESGDDELFEELYFTLICLLTNTLSHGLAFYWNRSKILRKRRKYDN